jgi:hypothetical protein
MHSRIVDHLCFVLPDEQSRDLGRIGIVEKLGAAILRLYFRASGIKETMFEVFPGL